MPTGLRRHKASFTLARGCAGLPGLKLRQGNEAEQELRRSSPGKRQPQAAKERGPQAHSPLHPRAAGKSRKALWLLPRNSLEEAAPLWEGKVESGM